MARRTVSVVVPVKDGERYLGELLEALLAQAPDEVLVIDSGSTDRSVAIAVGLEGVRVLEIEPGSFGHGRTRNLGASSTVGEVICFLTQDATPVPGWLEAMLGGFDLAGDVGAVYGPHLAREDTSPMIARELAEFFAGHAGPEGGPALQREGDEAFLSNVNAGYRRDCWEAIGFADVPYSEDQAFSRAMLAAGWAKAYVPEAAVLHAHDYPPVQFMRRYYDEYRGLRTTIGHVEPFGVRSTVRDVRSLVAADRAWAGSSSGAGLVARSAVHHTGRKVFSALGSRAHRMPPAVQKRLSLEGTVATGEPTAATVTGPPVGKHIPAAKKPLVWDSVRRYAKQGPAPLLDVLPGQAEDAPLHIACVIPPFARGSGGHNSILQIMSRLEGMGHTVSYWIDDEHGFMAGDRAARIRRDMRDWFAPIRGPVFKGFEEWYGCDVVVATGWQTAHNVMMLPGCRARAYLVHDHEPEFYATSVESRFAEATYRLDMHCICASPWLEQIMRERYGRTTSVFDFGVDHDAYQPRPIERRRDTIALYGRDITPRRAVPLALMAIQEVAEHVPDLRVVTFGSPEKIDIPVDSVDVGVLGPEELSWIFCASTLGVVLSLTNYSLIPQEMMACGLPCVDLAGISAESVFGPDGAITLSDFDPVDLATKIVDLMTDRPNWETRSAEGRSFVARRTWDVAAEQAESGLRQAFVFRSVSVAA